MGAPGLAMGRGWVTRVVLPAVVVALLAGMWPSAPVTVVAKAPPTKPPPGQTCQHGLLERRAPTEGSCTTTDLGPQSASLPAGFTESVLWDGQLDNPTAVALRRPTGGSSSPRRAGSSRSSTASRTRPPRRSSPTCGTNVHNYWDRGLLGMALDPSFPTAPRAVRLRPLHLRPHPRRRRHRRATVGRRLYSDGSRADPDRRDGCVVSGRLSRLTVERRPRSAGPSRSSSRTGASSSRATRSARSRSAPTARCT